MFQLSFHYPSPKKLSWHLLKHGISGLKTYNNLFSIKLHYGGKFTDSPNKQYVDGEFCFVNMLDIDDFKVDILNSVMCSIGYEDDDELLLYYKIPPKSLDVGLKQVVSETDISNKNFKGYVKNHKIMDFYLELVEKTNSSSDEDGQSDTESEDANDLVDDEHLIEEVEVDMNSFYFQLDGEDETDSIDPIQPHVNLTKDDLEVLDFDSLKIDQEDVPKNARSRGLRKLRKKHMSSGIKNNFYIGKEFTNRELAKERIRAYAVDTRRNLEFKVNDKRMMMVICNGVVPTLNSVNEYVDKIQGPNQDISKKGKRIMQDAKEDKMSCPWLLCLSKGDKSKKWEISGILCKHVIAVIHDMADNGCKGIGSSGGQMFDMPTREPVGSETMASQSVASQHVPTQTSSRGPVKSEHVASQTVGSETMASQSVASQHVTSQTKSRGPIASEPVASQTVGHEIMASHSVANQLVAIQTRSRGPVASEPMASQTVARKPMTKKLVQNKSVANKRAASQINEPTSQASHSSQPASQASRLPTSPIKRTKMSVCRLTPDN
nr:transposase, MuDR [Tanacetum cinerariifolium]